MSQDSPDPPPRQNLPNIQQTAGDNATQIGQVFGNVIIRQFQRHPFLLYLVLILAIVGLCILGWMVTSLTGLGRGYLGFVGDITCGVCQITNSSSASVQADTPVAVPSTITPTSTPTNTPTPQCTVVTPVLNLRYGPGTDYDPPIAQLVKDTILTPLGRYIDGTWLQVQVQETHQVGWIRNDDAYVDCKSLNVDSLPVPPIPPMPSEQTPSLSPTDTVPPPPQEPTPAQASDGFSGLWRGATAQGESISFQVAPDAIGEAALNLSFSFVFDPPCPIGKVSFSSLDSAHIFGGPSYSFGFPGLTASNARASVEGGFTSKTDATGNIRVIDDRSSSERLDRRCEFRTIITWNAKKE
jgi:hypothetical protein